MLRPGSRRLCARRRVVWQGIAHEIDPMLIRFRQQMKLLGNLSGLEVTSL